MLLYMLADVSDGFSSHGMSSSYQPAGAVVPYNRVDTAH